MKLIQLLFNWIMNHLTSRRDIEAAKADLQQRKKQKLTTRIPGSTPRDAPIWNAPQPPANTAVYDLQRYLLTRTEKRFYNILQEANSGLTICPMVRMIDFLTVRRDAPSRQSHKNRIMQKHVDFLLCRPADLRPVLAIEVDDTSHDRPDRQSRDEFVEQVYADTGLPFLRIRVGHFPTPTELAADIAALTEPQQ